MLRILLVDDEMNVLIGMKYILNKYYRDHILVGMAQSAQDALQMIANHEVDVMITDVKMPDLTGIDLLKAVKPKYPDLYIIILSGYSDFELVVLALKCGAYDYLLKPCKYQSVLELLNKIHSELLAKNEKIMDLRNKVILREMMLGQAPLLEFWKAYPALFMVVFSVPFMDIADIEFIVSRTFVNHKTHILNNTVDVASENLVYIFNGELSEDTLTNNLEMAKQSIKQELNHKNPAIFIAYSAISTENSNCIEKSYTNCKRMMDLLIFNELSITITSSQYKKIMNHQPYRLNDYYSAEILKHFIYNGKFDDGIQYIILNVNKLLMLDICLDPIKIKKEILEELFSLVNIVRGYHIDIDEVFDMQIDLINELNKIHVKLQLFTWLKNFTVAILSCFNNGTSFPPYILSALNYIEKNYMSDISLRDVADKIFLNQWYFSTQFKKYLGISYIDYINKLRIQKAKELLKQKNLKVYQVAQMVGFQDAAYFASVFKSLENISPKKYQSL